MGILKTSVSAMALAVTTALPAQAIEDDPFAIFATCAGRLSALMELQWLLGDPDADITQRQRAAVLDLLAAAMHPGQEGDALNLRITAKQAHAVLLTRATFNDDASDAAWATTQAARHQGDCLSFLLG